MSQYPDFRLLLAISEDAKLTAKRIEESALEALRRLETFPAFAEAQVNRLSKLESVKGGRPLPRIVDILADAIARLNINGEAFLPLVNDVQSQNDFIAVLLYWERMMLQDLSGGIPAEYYVAESPDAIAAQAEIRRMVQEWTRKGYQRIAESRLGLIADRRAAPDHSEKSDLVPQIHGAVSPRERVEAYIQRVLDETGERITRTDIWQVAGYEDATQFERFQRNQKASAGSRTKFVRVLGLSPDEFLRRREKIKTAAQMKRVADRATTLSGSERRKN
jgi:hypothetical protein